MDISARVKDWQLWTTYCHNNGHTDPYLANSPSHTRANLLVAFAARIRTGQLGRGNQVKSATVAVAVRHVGQMFEMAHRPDPRRPSGGQDLNLIFSRLLKSYANVDPSTVSQIALPVKIFENIAANEGASPDPLKQAVSDIIIMMFYFLLRVGEITCSTGRNPRRTVQFRRCDVSFWQKQPNGRLTRLAATAPFTVLCAADEVTLKLTNQKNGVRDATLHHERVPGPFCPVRATARRYDASRRAKPHDHNAMLCYFAPHSAVKAKHVDQVLERGAFRLMLWEEGFEMAHIGPHSIRASGAMALYLNDVSEDKIMLLGRWRSKTWLTYIHTQIAAVTAGVSRLMSRPVMFHNISGRRA